MMRFARTALRRVPVTAVILPPSEEFPAGEIVGDDFDNYADRTALVAAMSTSGDTSKKYEYVQNISDIDLETTVLWQGKKTMRYTQPTGSSSSPQCEVYFGSNHSTYYDNLWSRFKVRFSVGFTLNGTGGNGPSYKFIFYGMPNAGSRAAAIYTNGGWAPELITRNDSLNSGPFYSDPQTEFTDGNWYDFIWHVRRYSDRRIRNRLWRAIDGNTPNLLWDEDGDPSPVNLYPAEQMNSVLLGRNFNTDRTATQYLYWGRWGTYDGDATPNPFGVD